MKQIEFERWEPDAENPCKLTYAGQRAAEDVFHELEAQLDSVGYLLDEYLLLDRRWQNGREMPRDAGFFCRTDYGGSEGIYLDMFLEWYEDSQRRTEHFMTGKTLGESDADMDRMSLISSAITKAIRGDNSVHARYIVVGGQSGPEETMSLNLSPDEQRLVAQALAEQITEGNATVKETLSQLADLIAGTKNTPDDTQAAGQTEKKLTQLLASKELGQLLKGQIEETLYLKPQMADSEESIKGFYKRVRSSLEAVSKETQKAAEGSTLSANLNEIKSNIDFMNDLNRNMTYFQMPVRFSEGTGNGELYVFTNKKTLHNNPENVSALLHLDMEHLGPVDVYVKLAGKNVTTNFCLEDSETLDFVYDHIDRLNARLEALGYTAHFEMKLTQPQENFDFEKDFLQGLRE